VLVGAIFLLALVPALPFPLLLVNLVLAAAHLGLRTHLRGERLGRTRKARRDVAGAAL